MDGFLYLALLVLLASIFVFFSQEFAALFKKIFKIPGLALIVPLLLASFLVIYFEVWITWLLFFTKAGLEKLINQLAAILPPNYYPSYVASILPLLVFSLLPIALLHWAAWRRGGFQPWPFLFSFIMALWLSLVILIAV